MKLTAVTEQQNNKDRLNIYIDDSFAFGLPLSVYVDHGLKVGQDLSAEEIEDLKIAGAFHQAYDRALTYLSGRPRSAQEMRTYLRQRLLYRHPDYQERSSSGELEVFKEEQNRMVEKIVAKLIVSGYINDVDFAKWWIANRREFKPRGKRLLLLELKTKGISNADIEEALTTPSETGHFSSERLEYSETEAAKTLANKYFRKIANLPHAEQKQKLSRYLAGKGFEWDVVSEVVRLVLDDNKGTTD